ncbi:MAG: hypothetical protein ACI841_002108, partial [Planctomycetota bacterium]
GSIVQHVLTIEDDDCPTVTFTSAMQALSEADGSALMMVTLSEATTLDVTIPFTLGGEAVDPDDYTISPSPLVILAGQLTADINVTLVEDMLYEYDELIDVTLTTPTNGELGANINHQLTIIDNDTRPTVGFRQLRDQAWEDSGIVGLMVDLSELSGAPVGIDFSFGGDAIAAPAIGADFLELGRPITIPAGELSVEMTLIILNDLDAEGTETIIVRLRDLVDATITPGRRRMGYSILDDDDPTSNTHLRGLRTSVSEIDLVASRVNEGALPQIVTVTNPNSEPVSLDSIRRVGGEQDEFGVTPLVPLPLMLGPGESTSFSVDLLPIAPGPKQTTLRLKQTPRSIPVTEVEARGSSFGLGGEEIFANAGYGAYIGGDSRVWLPDYGRTGESIVVSGIAFITGATEQGLYRSARSGASFGYHWGLPNGEYELTLHMVELAWGFPGLRIFDVSIEGVVEVDDLDLFASAGLNVAHPVTLPVTVTDGMLDIELFASTGEAMISALELRSIPIVSLDSSAIDFETVEQGQFDERIVRLQNTGLAPAELSSLSIQLNLGSAVDFSIEIGSDIYPGTSGSQTFPVDYTVPSMGELPITVVFTPTEHNEHDFDLGFDGEFGTLATSIAATGGANAGWGFLHPVIAYDPPFVVDYDNSGSEEIHLIGTGSHTHEQGQGIAAWDWEDGGQLVFSTDESTTSSFAVGAHSLALTIYDDNLPAQSAALPGSVTVYPADLVPGMLTEYSDAGGTGPIALLDTPPLIKEFTERELNLTLFVQDGRVGGSDFTGNVLIQRTANFDVASLATYDFHIAGGIDSRLIVDGQQLSGAGTLQVVLTPGTYSIDARFAVINLADMPLSLSVDIGGTPTPSFEDTLTYDSQGIAPVIHAMEQDGSDLGGNLVTIEGFGFYPSDQVTVQWGPLITFDLAGPAYAFSSQSPDMIQLVTPSGALALGGPTKGQISVTVTTPNGTSQVRPFEYSDSGPVPIQFGIDPDKWSVIIDPTCGAWGADGRLYVGVIGGHVKAITYDDAYNPLSLQTYGGVSGLTNSDLVGITVNPYDPPSPVKVYVSHGLMYEFGGNLPDGPSTFSGAVTMLQEPLFDATVAPSAALLTNLPISNHDHGINGMVFDHNGDLLLGSGGQTNAGVEHLALGGLPESPLSAAILRARTSKAGFDGAVTYVLRSDGSTPSTDQRDGHDIIQSGGDIEVYAPGLRNPFDLVLTTWGSLYCTDNGPNLWQTGFGLASLGPNVESELSPHSNTDKIVLIEHDNYYGHASRQRGQDDYRQFIFHYFNEAPIPGEFTQKIGEYTSSTNGIAEYRARTFDDAMRGNLIAQRYSDRSVRVELTPDRRGVVDVHEDIPYMKGLSVVTGPGGALLAMDYTGNRVKIMEPSDISVSGPTAFDIHPWRATQTGGYPFVIGGENFGTLGDTSVTIGGLPATLTHVSATRIKGTVPANPLPPIDLVDVVVTVAGQMTTLDESFLYLPASPEPVPGWWTTGASMPDTVGEVACGIVGGEMFLVGESSTKTYTYGLLTNTWTDTAAIRPYPGSHHSAEVVADKLYLIGGLGGGEGKVQIYDPNKDSWSLGADMLWGGGSVSTCEIGGLIYVAGGIVGGGTVTNCAVYDPQLNGWTALTNLPLATAVNHAAATTDGQRFWIFGGRGGGNIPQPGLTCVQVYDPVLDSWETSQDVGTSLVDLPGGRGGTGKAIWYQGEFYVFGGETTNTDADPEATADSVFPQVRAYRPETGVWRDDRELITARHGIYPLVFQGRVFVAGGGIKFGLSSSNVLEIFHR